MNIRPAKSLKGIITVPGDKSISHRAVMIGALATGKTVVENFLPGEDCLSTVSCFRALGADIAIEKQRCVINGNGLYSLSETSEVLNAGNSGTTTRLMAGILAGQNFSSVIDGDESLRRRPMKRVIVPISLMGGDISARDNNYCPLYIKGRSLKGIDYILPVASAQLKSSILFASLYAGSKSSITEPSQSRDHTEIMLKSFGATIERNGLTTVIYPPNNLYSTDIFVPGDISSAAFFIVAALICPNSEIVIKDVGINPTRTGIIDALIQMGANIKLENIKSCGEPTADIYVKYSALSPITIGGDIIPRMIDELPVFAVAALFANGTTVIRDAAELRAKESDRIEVMSLELKKAGADVEATCDGMIINGGKGLCPADFASHGDHRVAMSLSVLAAALEHPSDISGFECVSISYPGFYDALISLYD